MTKSDCISISQTPREPTEVSQRAAGSVADSSSTTESGVNLWRSHPSHGVQLSSPPLPSHISSRIKRQLHWSMHGDEPSRAMESCSDTLCPLTSFLAKEWKSGHGGFKGQGSCGHRGDIPKSRRTSLNLLPWMDTPNLFLPPRRVIFLSEASAICVFLRGLHTAQTQTNGQLHSSDHPVASLLTRSAE